MKVAIYGQPTDNSLADLIRPFLQKLHSRGIAYCIEHAFAEFLQNTYSVDFSQAERFSENKDLPPDIELFFTIGGDGTILKAGTILRDRQVPVVGINSGRLGFLATISMHEFLSDLDAILDKDFNLSPRSMVRVEVEGTELRHNFALNEVAISRKETTSMVVIETHLNGSYFNHFWADGLIVATPTGSTGYSLSCGGPIIDPTTSNLVITPIAPHNLNIRPFIVPDSSYLELKIESRVPEFLLSLDSRLHSISTCKTLRISKNPFPLTIVERKGSPYITTLREKLHWGIDQRN